jgi:hypothetical protein
LKGSAGLQLAERPIVQAATGKELKGSSISFKSAGGTFTEVATGKELKDGYCKLPVLKPQFKQQLGKN